MTNFESVYTENVELLNNNKDTKFKNTINDKNNIFNIFGKKSKLKNNGNNNFLLKHFNLIYFLYVIIALMTYKFYDEGIFLKIQQIPTLEYEKNILSENLIKSKKELAALEKIDISDLNDKHQNIYKVFPVFNEIEQINRIIQLAEESGINGLPINKIKNKFSSNQIDSFGKTLPDGIDNFLEKTSYIKYTLEFSATEETFLDFYNKLNERLEFVMGPYTLQEEKGLVKINLSIYGYYPNITN